MKYYYIYEFFFPTFLAFAALPFVFLGLTGVVGRRPLVYPAWANTLFAIFIGVPVFLLSLNHLITEPVADTWRCWLLNFSGVVGIPAIIVWSILWSEGTAMFGRTREEHIRDLETALGLMEVRCRWWGFTGKIGERTVQVCQLRGVYLGVSKMRSFSSSERRELREKLIAHFEERSIRSSSRPYVALLVLGVALASTSFGTWCVATQCFMV